MRVRVGESHDSAIEGNCVAVRQGGEQPEVKDWSVGDEPDSAGCCGELACKGRNPKHAVHAEMADKAMCGRIKWLGAERSEVRAR